MAMKNLLVELFVEELPPKALKKLGESFASSLEESLKREGLLIADSETTAYASPRRLAAHVSGVLERAPRTRTSKKLMPSSVAYDSEGARTPALSKRIEKEGGLNQAIGDKLVKRLESGSEYVFLDREEGGESLHFHLSFALQHGLRNLPIPKAMTYQLADGWSSVNFVRPAHRLVALHGADVVPVSLLGLNAGRETQGHRFEANADVVAIRDADSYAEQMEREGAVIPGFAARRQEIERQIEAAAAKEGLQPIDDDALLDEVTALVERPNVLVCQFDREFLDVPQECLILTMKANQKYFPLLDVSKGNEGKLTNKFLVVSNIRPDDASAVIGGNERVVRPRLADAKFFFDQDRKKPLDSRVLGLAKVVYHNKLGTQGDRVERVQAIARGIADALGGGELTHMADRAALLAKADLLTDMVGEFPELQGIMGRYYALHDGEPAEIADAIEDHYKPRFAGDGLPRGKVGTVVALADKIETLTGMFGIGQVPTGDKDPFALRRHALGVIRMLSEGDLDLPLDRLLNMAGANFDKIDNFGLPADALADFIYERLAGSLREQGYSALEVDAVVGLRPQRLGDIPKRLAAVRAFGELPEAASLAAANKRVGNILKKAEGTVSARVDAALLKEPAEIALNAALAQAKPAADAAFERGDYAASLKALAALKTPVDEFFDKVMVNAEDAALRANRLGLLATLHSAMNRVADISKLSA